MKRDLDNFCLTKLFYYHQNITEVVYVLRLLKTLLKNRLRISEARGLISPTTKSLIIAIGKNTKLTFQTLALMKALRSKCQLCAFITAMINFFNLELVQPRATSVLV